MRIKCPHTGNYDSLKRTKKINNDCPQEIPEIRL